MTGDGAGFSRCVRYESNVSLLSPHCFGKMAIVRGERQVFPG